MGIMIPTTINLEYMNILETSRFYKILYKLPYINLSGIIIKLEDIIITGYTSYYKIIINNKDNIELLKNIEQYLISRISNYRQIVKSHDSINYITIKKNTNTSSIINKYSGQNMIYINLLKIIKTAFYSSLIIYVL
jgi:hypothetical protein